jgi:hypothetical protein
MALYFESVQGIKNEKVGVAKKGRKGKQCLPNPLLIFMFDQIFYKLNDLGQKRFVEDLVLLITKGICIYLLF